MADLCSFTWNSILQLCFYNFGFHMIYLWLITVTHLCLQTVLLIITFVKATFVNYKCHHCHIRCCGVIWSAFTFSEELGFEEGWHGGFLPSWKWNLLTSWWFEHLHTLFMVEWHLGEVYLIFNSGFVIYCSICVFLIALIWEHMFLHWNSKPFGYLLF